MSTSSEEWCFGRKQGGHWNLGLYNVSLCMIEIECIALLSAIAAHHISEPHGNCQTCRNFLVKPVHLASAVVKAGNTQMHFPHDESRENCLSELWRILRLLGEEEQDDTWGRQLIRLCRFDGSSVCSRRMSRRLTMLNCMRGSAIVKIFQK